MKTYTIMEDNEKRGLRSGESFNTLKEAVARLGVQKFVADRHGRTTKGTSTSFVWYWEDEYNTTYRTKFYIARS